MQCSATMNVQVFLLVTIIVDTGGCPARPPLSITGVSKRRNILTKCVCGRDSQRQDRDDLAYRVVGGVEMGQKNHRFLAAIWTKRRFSCGGSVVSPYHILTAAHCTVNNTVTDMKVYLGLHMKKDLQNVEVFPVLEIIRHSGYREIGNLFVVNDIALLRVDRIHFKDTIQPICIPFYNEMGQATVGSVAGWGVTKYDGKSSPLPRHAYLRIMSPQECIGSPWGASMRTIPDSYMMVVCAYSPAIDACQGDSGGPLYAKSLMGTNFQIGIISFGEECANDKGIPGIYTNLAYFGNWLRENLRGEECAQPS